MRNYIVMAAVAASLGLPLAAQAQVEVREGNPPATATAVQTPSEALQTQRRVRVIVTLEDPAESGGNLSPREIRALQDAVIESVFDTTASAMESGSNPYGLSRLTVVPAFAVNVDEAELRRLQSDPRVENVALDMELDAFLTQSTKIIGMPAAWKAPYRATGDGETVAIVDTGVNLNHKFLDDSRIIGQACFSGAGNPAASFCPNGTTRQTGGNSGKNCPTKFAAGCVHGTHVAGIAAGYNTNPKDGEPLEGVAFDANIVAVQVFKKTKDDDGNDAIDTSFSDIFVALDWLYRNRNKFETPLTSINMSLGGGGPFTTNCDQDPLGRVMKVMIRRFRRADVAVVIASGNDGFTDGVAMPACVSNAITVGATTKWTFGQEERTAYYSNMGRMVDVLAPGGDAFYPVDTPYVSTILSSVPGNKFKGLQGTSMAAPHVAGVFAAIRSADKCGGKSVAAIEKALEKTGKKITDVNYTRRRVNLPRAMRRLGCN
ncbi:S8 family peptidase [Microbaculum marinum]|uniref:S8 family serine peptidase n=1 Tax=Microbaculum marinum TaxID=1764581 RepID=A0AAW9RW27_9HYPH